ncbi:hypothetical protein HPB52_003292 [Rhipicephalus sanguineus]|uniref:E3 ubiquitin protein ligase n=1 Tax=Rhipicephalus sanguineus TaxID=34632 RepID=A0A9D4SVJ9_RHISA|nr:hypothetical protein HPB52_003292 [Rhipicephalus sanguineus]
MPRYARARRDALAPVAVALQEEMDMKTLQFQNRKLAQGLDHRIRQESELWARVEQLEKWQTSDEGVLTVVNR